MDNITTEQLKEALPANLKSFANQDLADKLNAISTDPLIADNIRKNFISYSLVLKEGKYKVEDYLNAVSYVSFKLMGYNNKEAYFRTFPSRQQQLVAQGRTEKEISAYVSAYHRGKLVNAIMEQSLVPTWILNQDIYQEAINTQFMLMKGARSERVQMMAADSLLNHLKKPENQAPLINIDMREGSGLEDLKKTIAELAQTQKQLIQSGMPTKTIAEQRIVQEIEDVE